MSPAAYVRSVTKTLDCMATQQLKEQRAEKDGYLLGLEMRENLTPASDDATCMHYQVLKGYMRQAMRQYGREVLVAFERGLADGSAE